MNATIAGTSRIEPEVLTLAEAAVELRVSKQTVRRWIRDGRLEHVVLPSKRLRVPVQALASMQVTPATPRNGHDKRSQKGRRP